MMVHGKGSGMKVVESNLYGEMYADTRRALLQACRVQVKRNEAEVSVVQDEVRELLWDGDFLTAMSAMANVRALECFNQLLDDFVAGVESRIGKESGGSE